MFSKLLQLFKPKKRLNKLIHTPPLAASLILCVFCSLNATALSFKTAVTETDNPEYVQPQYPLVFVSTKITEQATNEGVEGVYNLGTDVLSANNPSGGNQLWILLPNGESKLLFPLPMHQQLGIIDTPEGLLASGSVVEPNLSEDGKTVYFSYFHNADQKMPQSGLPKLGADLYSINIAALLANYSLAPQQLTAKRLTQANIVDTNGNLSFDELYKDAQNPTLKGNTSNNWGTVYMHPEEMRTKYGLKLVYVSDKKRLSNSNRAMGYANHNFNLFIADINDDGSLSNHQQFQYYTTTSALSPNRLRNGIAFSYQATTEDARHWQIQGLTSSGKWFPIFGYGNNPEAAHLSTFCVKSKGENPGDYLITSSYYNLNNNGFGSLHSVKLSMAGLNAYDQPDGSIIVPRQLGAKKITKGVIVNDLPALKRNGQTLGKFTSPRCGLADELYFSHTATSANGRGFDSESNRHFYRAYIGFRNNLEAFYSTDEVDLNKGTGVAKVIVDATGERNLLWPLPILNWQQRTGDLEQAYTAPAVASESGISAGSPFAEVGTSALWNTDRRPFDCWLGSHGQVPYSPNKAYKNVNSERQELVAQSAGLNRVQNPNDFCEYLLPENVLGVSVNITSNDLKGSYGNYQSENESHKETSKLLGVYSVVGQNDQSFKAIIPANTPFDFHLLDRKTGLKLTDVRSWHSLKPEESRTDCGGCHQHEKGKGISFEGTFAQLNEPLDMVNETQYVDYDATCQPEMKTDSAATRAPLEWKSDIWPGFDKNCSSCHNETISDDTAAITALGYATEEEAYQLLADRNYISHTLGALGSSAWWAARGQRTDGRDNTLAKYAPDYANQQWGFKFSDIHQTTNTLCDGSSLENAQWVYKFGHWIDNFQHRDIGDGVFNTKLDRYHPTINSAIVGQCNANLVNVGWWDDSGHVAQVAVSINNTTIITLDDQDNSSTQVNLNNASESDAIFVEVEDAAGNRQSYQKSIKDLRAECVVRIEGSTTTVTAKPYTHENDYTDEQTDIGTILNEAAVDEASNLPAVDIEAGVDPATDAFVTLPADIDNPVETDRDYKVIKLAVTADATISNYNANEATMNFGGASKIRTWQGDSRKILLKADFNNVSNATTLIKARLKLFALSTQYTNYPKILAYKLNTPWVEGSQIWSSAPDGATWFEYNYNDHQASDANNWSVAGGDIDTQADYGYGENGLIKRADVNQGQWTSLDITAVVHQWIADPSSNHGLMLRGLMKQGGALNFASKEHEDATLIPYIEFIYQGELNTTPTEEGPSKTPNIAQEIESFEHLPEDNDDALASEATLPRVKLPITADTTISSYNSSEAQMNFGGSNKIRTWKGDSRKILIKPDLDSVARGKKVLKARLKLFTLSTAYTSSPKLLAYKLNSPWVEGTQKWSSSPDGATWFEHDYKDHQASSSNDWNVPGGDINAVTNYGYGENGLIKRAPIVAEQWTSIDITPVVQEWLAKPDTNHGLMLRGLMKNGGALNFASKEHADPALRPYVEFIYQDEVINYPSIESVEQLPADIDQPIVIDERTATVLLPVIADTTISRYNTSEAQMNFGGANYIRTWQGDSRKILLQAGLENAPVGKKVLKARLKLFTLSTKYTKSPKLFAYKLNAPWVEGTQIWSHSPNGATWLEYNYHDHQTTPAHDWQVAGGDINTTDNYGYGDNGLIKRAPVVSGEWLSLDITIAMQAWLAAPNSNHGLMLRGLMKNGGALRFASKEHEDNTLRPYIELIYQN